MNRKAGLMAATAIRWISAQYARGRSSIALEGATSVKRGVKSPKSSIRSNIHAATPEKRAIGPIGRHGVESQDNVWVLHRPGPLQKKERFAGAGMTPPRRIAASGTAVLALDRTASIASWGGPGQGYEWPPIEHGIFVDCEGPKYLVRQRREG